MKKIKVLRIIARLNIGGPAIHTILLTAKINNEQFHSYLLTGEVEENESDMIYLADKYKVKPLIISDMGREIRPLRDMKTFLRIYKLIQTIKPDIVHTHTAKAGTVGRLAAFIAGVPNIVHTFHGNIFKGYFGKLKTSIFLLIEKSLACISSKIIAISEQQKKELVDLKIAQPNKIKIIHLGFNFENILPSSSHKNRFKSKFNLPLQCKLIGIVGRLVPIKNHTLFIDIVEEVARRYDDIYFTIIGDGEMKGFLETEVKRRDLTERIIFTGFLQDLKSVYADLDIVLLTSINEGTPVAIIESMASEKMVMSTNVGGVGDFVKNGVNGFVFDKMSPKPFVKEICKWVDSNNAEKYSRIRSNARKTAYKMFNYNKLILAMQKLYLNLMKTMSE